MKVLLIQPKIEAVVTFQDFMLAPPLTLELLAATLQDHEVRILDLRVQNGLIEELALFQPDIVGITCLTQEVNAALKILTRVKEYNAHILTVVGGIHVSLVPRDFEREFVDVIVIGEGEVTLRELVDAYQDQKSLKGITGIEYMDDGHWIQTHPRAFIPDLDRLPSPDHRLNKEYADHYFSMAVSPVGALLTSRGCPFRCKFCSVWKLFSQKCRYMTAERVVEELRNIDAGYVIIFDDNFLQNIPRAETIYEMIRSEGVRKEYFIQARSDTVSRNAGIIEKWGIRWRLKCCAATNGLTLGW